MHSFYPVLSFHLPVQPNVSDKGIIGAFKEWIRRSPHYDFIASELNSLMDSDETASTKNLAGKSAVLLHHRRITDTGSCIALRVDNPDSANNLLWRAECIYVREKTPPASCTLHVQLGRAPLEEGTSMNLATIPGIPFIAKKLLWDHWIVGETGGPSLQEPVYFPVIFCGRRTARVDPVFDNLQKKLGPIAQILMEGAPLPPDLAKQFHDTMGTDGVCVFFPAARVLKRYPHVMAEAPNGPGVGRVISDVVRWVTEAQNASTLTWAAAGLPEDADAGGAPDEKGPYCAMNSAMAARLRELRRRKGLSQKALGGEVNSSGLIISRLETGRMLRVPLRVLNEIERVLDAEEGAITSLQRAEPAPSQPAPPPPAQPQSPPVAAAEREPEQPLRKTAFCRRCGCHLYQDSLFCPACGTKVLD